MFCYNRSSDLFLGLPFNIASSSLLLIMIAKVCGLTPRFINISLGDAHIYAVHTEQARLQISRVPYVFPTLVIDGQAKSVEDLEKLEFKDFGLNNYQCHPGIKGMMVA
jgi:thymidylate synthase